MLIDDIREPDRRRARGRARAARSRRARCRSAAQEVFVSPSIGVAVSSPEHRSADEVVRDADLAMYRAKGAGGGRYAVFDAAMHQGALERLQLETELRRAVERQEFRLWYQPIVVAVDRQRGRASRRWSGGSIPSAACSRPARSCRWRRNWA